MLAGRQTDTQTDRQSDRNSPLLYRGGAKSDLYNQSQFRPNWHDSNYTSVQLITLATSGNSDTDKTYRYENECDKSTHHYSSMYQPTGMAR